MELSRFGADGLGGAILHGDHFAGMLDFDGQVAMSFVLREFLAENILLADQNDTDAQRAGGANGSVDLRLRGVIAAHCVNRDGHHGMTTYPCRYSSATSITSRPL